MIAASPIPPLAQHFIILKGYLLKGFGLPRDSMHVHLGLALFVPLWLVLGRRKWWLPLALLALVSLVAEVLDVAALLAVKSPVDPYESLRDVASTLAWPAVFSLLLRWRQRG